MGRGANMARIIGTYDSKGLGLIPVVEVEGGKPRLRNNGYACFHGQPDLKIEGLSAALGGGLCPGGHVMLRYGDGKEFLAFAGCNRGDEVFSFS